MSTNIPTSEFKVHTDIRVAVIVAEWNGEITSRLLDGALRVLRSNGIADDKIDVLHVPGAVELTYGAAKAMSAGHYDAVIVFGAVVRGDTPHFDYVCESVTQGVALLNSRGEVPVIFGVLTVNNEQQAFDRLGGPAGHKGEEAADTALRMISFSRNL